MPVEPINPWRGEVALRLDGETYMLRPSFTALCAIEQHLDTGLYALAHQLAEGELPLQALKTIISLCCVQEVSEADCEAALLHGGLRAATQAVTQLFALILEGFPRE